MEYTDEQRESDQRLVNWSDAVERGDIMETSLYWRLQEEVIKARARLAKHAKAAAEDNRQI